MLYKAKILLTSYFLLLTSFFHCQTNLVPNFSFETYTNCPNTGDQIENSLGWSKYSQTTTTPDYYNACSSPSAMGVPKSYSCYQLEKRNCNSYVGLCTYAATSANYREQIGIQLSQPLSIGQKYFISFYTVLGEYWAGANLYGMPSNNIGLRLSTASFNTSNPVPINNFSHLKSSTVIADSINWKLISGSIIADSAYNYVSVGNFYNDLNTTVTNYGCGYCLDLGCFYLIDDICISTDSLLCNGGISSLPCSFTGVNENEKSTKFSLYPNPVTDKLDILLDKKLNFEIEIVDLVGKKYYFEKIFEKEKTQIEFSSAEAGIYFLRISDKEKSFHSLIKIIKL